ncbi:MAG: TonB-dependent receptor plug domain-containing protein [Gammaproteobacteria bacterium]
MKSNQVIEEATFGHLSAGIRCVVLKSRFMALAICAHATVPAADTITSTLDYQLPPVTVHASNFADWRASVNPVTEIDPRTPSQENKTDLDPMLRGQAGVQLLRTTRGGLSGLWVRGASAGQGQLLLDGIPVYSTVTGTFNLDAFSPDLLERVEVERGATAPRYGSLALGGVVQLSTREAHEDGAFVHVQGGSFGTLSESVGASLVGKAGRLSLTARHEDIFDGVSQADARNGNSERDGFYSNSAALRYGAEFAERVALDTSVYYSRTRAEIDGVGLLPSGRLAVVDDPSAFGLTETLVAQQGVETRLFPAWNTGLKFGLNREDVLLQVNGFSGTSDVRLLLARWHNRHEFYFGDEPQHSGLHLAWGGEWRQENVDAASAFSAVQDNRSRFAGFWDMAAAFGSGNVIAGVRIDGYQEASTRPVYYFGLAWKFSDHLALRASGGRGYRVPSFHELFFPVFGNPLLRPEEARSGEIGIDWSPISTFRFSATGFYQRYRQLILASFDPAQGRLVAGNIGQARILGTEITGDYAPGNGWTAGLSYTFLESRDLGNHRALPRLPKHQGRFFVQHALSLWPVTIVIESLYRSGHFSDPSLSLPAGDAFLLNFQAAYRISPGLKLFVRGENITNNRTEPDFSFGTPGAAVYGGFRAKF